MTQPQWLDWAKRLQSIAQSGLAFSSDPFDIERFEQVHALAAEIAARHTELSQEKLVGLFSAETGYACPKIGVRAAVIDHINNKPHLLLTRELAENGAWTLPGGYVDIGDTPSQAVERETFEETGYIVRADKVIAVCDRNNLPEALASWIEIWVTVFRCELIGGEPTSSIETGESRFFPLDELPEMSLRRSHPQLVKWNQAAC